MEPESLHTSNNSHPMTETDLEKAEPAAMVRTSAWLMGVLSAVHAQQIPEAWVCAHRPGERWPGVTVISPG
jgi:hypothetical protein